MLNPGKAVHRGVVLDGHGILVDACVHPVIAHYLCAVEPAVGGREGNLDGHLGGSGIVARMGAGMDGGGEVGDVHLLQPLGRQTGGCHRDVEHLGDGRAYCTLVFHRVAQHHVVCHDACLPVGGSCQEIEPGLSRDGMGELNGIAHGIDVLVRGLQIPVHPYAPHLSQPQAGGCGQSCFRPHADGEEHHVGLQFHPRLEMDGQFVPVPGKRFHGLLQIQPYAMLQQMLVHQGGHREVDGCHHLWRHLHDSHFRSGMNKVFRHLQPDEAAAHDDRPLHPMLLYVCLYPVRVVHVPQREDAFAVDALQRRTHGRGTGRKQQLVVGLGVCLSVGGPHAHRAGLGVDGRHLAARAHIDAEAAAEGLGRLHEHAVARFYHSAYVIGQSAVGIRYVWSLLEEDDFGLFRQSPHAGSGRGTSCHTAHNHQSFLPCLHCLHVLVLVIYI